MHRLSNQTHAHIMKTRSLLLMLISQGILVFVYVQLLMVLRMVYWCALIGITFQRSISYTLASFGRCCLLYFLSKHMCKLQSKLLAHMQGEQLLPYGVHKTLSANLVCQGDYEKGSTTPSDEAMAKIMTMAMAW